MKDKRSVMRDLAIVYRHKMFIKEKVQTLDPVGQPIEGWETIAEVYASIDPIRGKEYWGNNQLQNEVTHRIKIRYIPGIDPSMKIFFRDRIFDIEVIRDFEEKNAGLEILATERRLVPDPGITADAIWGDSDDPIGDSSDPW